jgi:hypothetical protein
MKDKIIIRISKSKLNEKSKNYIKSISECEYIPHSCRVYATKFKSIKETIIYNIKWLKSK